MGKLFKLQCSKCDFTKTVCEGSTRLLANEFITVSCDACCSIENRSYDFPENCPVRPEPGTGWWGRKNRQKELNDRYLTESAHWNAEMDKRRVEALQQPCSQCVSAVQSVHFGDPFIEPIPIGIGCPACKCQGCMNVALEALID
ncbi:MULTISPECIES: hypothetical protein [unclassified Marinobacterium]|uniref:hypothetical protein n=1 Tax=unclassified Marinobacterium TaxID=2644139 RepID=UPI001569BAEE|nr:MULTISPECIES: hypothetical protein [unclassified Marinobacterium]NRP16154.1 hypothetical protein [Marinobacterium sp. xm-a-152]NRP38144.1 hypothetical protein [Marinobacterium sp. xm-a-121]NRP57584.1 hypothetical protein [Marinobacterium sp. xm-d-510]NRP98096.1 hypothetical protein [Marinobacterium sp. xm-a-127]NRP98840.1 hypothetical protein [Marinobacterium sp. xm-v-233]